MDWYYSEAGERRGPVDDAAFRGLVSNGVIVPETLVWNASLTQWQTWRSLQSPPGIPLEAPVDYGAPARFVCVECGGEFNELEGVAYHRSFVCAGCKPVFFRRVKQGAALPGEIRYGRFGKRFIAKIIDALVIMSVSYSVMGLSLQYFSEKAAADRNGFFFMSGGMVAVNVTSYLFSLLYYTFFVGRYGATPGKYLLGLRVVTERHEQPTMARALGRAAAEFISALTCNIGYLMAAFDDESRTLHDRIANTRVVETQEGGQ